MDIAAGRRFGLPALKRSLLERKMRNKTGTSLRLDSERKAEASRCRICCRVIRQELREKHLGSTSPLLLSSPCGEANAPDLDIYTP